jgi:hypothetical protein
MPQLSEENRTPFWERHSDLKVVIHDTLVNKAD